jgi:DNA repair exonuclease SbcCD nuclease subunit
MSKKILFYCSADFHLQTKTPVCRRDKDFLELQATKLDFISETVGEYPLLVAGDLFDSHIPSIKLLDMVIDHMPFLYTIIGNHDCGNNEIYGISVLEKINKLCIVDKPILLDGFTLYGKGYHQESTPELVEGRDVPDVLMTHEMVWQHTPPYPGLDIRTNSNGVINKYIDFEFILSGHNHHYFTSRLGDNVLLNPGSILRLTSSQKLYRPQIFRVYEDLTIKGIEIPIDNTMISDKHIVEKQKVDVVLDNFLNSLKVDVCQELNFRERVIYFMDSNYIEDSVKQVLMQILLGNN